MRRFLQLALLLACATLLPTIAHAQQPIEQACPTGDTQIGGSPSTTTDPTTGPLGSLRFNLCLEPNGRIFAQMDGTGGTSGAGGPIINVSQAPYSAVPDGTTDNSAAFLAAFNAANGVTGGRPTVYFPCITNAAPQCIYKYGGSGISPINPLIASTIECDSGVVLLYSGSAHALDVGPAGLMAPQYNNNALIYRLTGCELQESATATQGIFVNQYVPYSQIDNFRFNDLVNGTWAIKYGAIGNYREQLYANWFGIDNNGTSSFVDGGTDNNNQMVATGNTAGCLSAPITACTGTPGIGIRTCGAKSVITQNDLNFMQNIQVCGESETISDNTLETPTASAFPCVTFSGNVTGLKMLNNYCNGHSDGAMLGPGVSTDTLASSTVNFNDYVNANGVPIVLNPITTQTGNSAEGNSCTAGPDITRVPPCQAIHSLAASRTAESWLTLDHFNYIDNLHYSNGAMPAPWLTQVGATGLTIASNLATCSTSFCGSIYGYDIPVNAMIGARIGTVPTGTDSVAVLGRFTYDGTFSDYYLCQYVSGTGIRLFWQNGGANGQLGSTYTTTTPMSGDVFSIQVIGNTVSCYLNASLVVGPISDSHVADQAGYGDLTIGGTSGTVSEFQIQGLP